MGEGELAGEGTHGANGGGGGVSVLRRKCERAEAKKEVGLCPGRGKGVGASVCGLCPRESRRDWRGVRRCGAVEPSSNGGECHAGFEAMATSIGEGDRCGVTARGGLNHRHCRLE